MNNYDKELFLPWKVYFFNQDGKYDPDYDVIAITNHNELKTNLSLRQRILEYNKFKCEVRICDCLDYCVIHFKEGRKVFPV